MTDLDVLGQAAVCLRSGYRKRTLSAPISGVARRMLRRMRAGVFDDGETFDLSWMDLPEGHSRISPARHALVDDSKGGLLLCRGRRGR